MQRPSEESPPQQSMYERRKLSALVSADAALAASSAVDPAYMSSELEPPYSAAATVPTGGGNQTVHDAGARGKPCCVPLAQTSAGLGNDG